MNETELLGVAPDNMKLQKYLNLRLLCVIITFLFAWVLLYFSFDADERVEDLEELNYAVVVDAGSSGSRLFVYVWPPHGGNPQDLLQIRPLINGNGEPVVMKTSPGLSSVADNPSRASDYIYPLLQFATSYIPSRKQKETQLYILATAGLRLLEKNVQDAILKDLREDIPQNFSFLVSGNNVDVISGELEGVYQWIATNYVLGRFDDHRKDEGEDIVVVDLPEGQSQHASVVRRQTVGILDMGGASLQIAVEVTNKLHVDDVRSSLLDINLGCVQHDVDHLYQVFVTTFLGMGANEARTAYENLLVAEIRAGNSGNRSSSAAEYIGDPCLAKGFKTQINISSENPSTNPTPVNLIGLGKFDACQTRLIQLVKNLTNCPGKSCLTTHLPLNLENTLFYGFSEFWYSMEDVFREGGKYYFKDFRKTAQGFCGTAWGNTLSRYNEKKYPLADWQRLTLECFKATWMTAVLHHGLGFSLNYNGLQSTPNNVHEKVFHWTLGALVYRTRFLRLKDLQKTAGQSVSRQSGVWPVQLTHHMLFLCIGLVVAAILVYLQRLRCLSRLCFSAARNNYNYNAVQLQDRLERGFVKDITFFK